VHGLTSVLDPDGEAVVGDDPPAPRRVLSPQVAYLITSALQGVIDRGTAAAARGWGLRGRLAGKTGTTNDRRDNWFAGYSPDRVTVVWVGYDDNRPTRLSGATAALPIWTRFTMAVQPAGGYADFPRPAGIVEATVDPTTGQLATDYCPYAVTDLFPDWQVPTEPCRRHEPGYNQMLADADPYGQEIDPLDPNTGQPIDDPYRLDTYVDQDGPRPQITNVPPEGQAGLEPLPQDASAEPATVTPVRRPHIIRLNPLQPVAGAGVDPAEIDTGNGQDGVSVEEGTGATPPETGSILIRPSRRRPTPLADPAAPPSPSPPAPSPTPADEGQDNVGNSGGVDVTVETPPATPPESTPPPPDGGL
jgi:membrane peptidoglycan carboxypeptidase